MNKKLLGPYGLKWNPFGPEVPPEALLATPKVDDFCWRVEHSHVKEGGFALGSVRDALGLAVSSEAYHIGGCTKQGIQAAVACDVHSRRRRGRDLRGRSEKTG